jgi:hypothetical protein
VRSVPDVETIFSVKIPLPKDKLQRTAAQPGG